ncbi:hypothetical protein [Desulfobulbus rhabdoformis]
MVRRSREHWGVGAYYQLNVMSIRGTCSSDLVKTRMGLQSPPFIKS